MVFTCQRAFHAAASEEARLMIKLNRMPVISQNNQHQHTSPKRIGACCSRIVPIEVQINAVNQL